MQTPQGGIVLGACFRGAPYAVAVHTRGKERGQKEGEPDQDEVMAVKAFRTLRFSATCMARWLPNKPHLGQCRFGRLAATAASFNDARRTVQATAAQAVHHGLFATGNRLFGGVKARVAVAARHHEAHPGVRPFHAAFSPSCAETTQIRPADFAAKQQASFRESKPQGLAQGFAAEGTSFCGKAHAAFFFERFHI